MGGGAPAALAFITATRNRAAVLASAVDALRAQTVAEIEIIVVDDGSTDATPATCARIASCDGRVRWLRSEGVGRSRARNLGVAAATAPWVSFLDDDDLVVEGFAAKMLAVVRSGVRACCCEALVFDAPLELPLTAAEVLRDAEGRFRPRRVPAEPLPDRIAFEDLLLRSLFPINAVVLERRLFHEVGGFRGDLDLGEDYELWLRVVAALGTIPVLHEPLALVRVHEQQSSRHLGAMAASTLRILDDARTRHAAALPPRAWRRRLAHLQRELAYAALLEGDGGAARRAAVASVRLWPFAWKSWAYAALSPLPRLYQWLRRAARKARRRPPRGV